MKNIDNLRECFLKKYPKYEIILRLFEEANNCPITWRNLSKVRLQVFVDYMSQRLAPNSVRQYCAKLKAVLNLFSDPTLFRIKKSVSDSSWSDLKNSDLNVI